MSASRDNPFVRVVCFVDLSLLHIKPRFCCRLCHFLWTLFSGFLITRPSMAAGFKWLYYVSGTAYVLYGNAAAQLGKEGRKTIVPGACQQYICPLRAAHAWHMPLYCRALRSP